MPVAVCEPLNVVSFRISCQINQLIQCFQGQGDINTASIERLNAAFRARPSTTIFAEQKSECAAVTPSLASVQPCTSAFT